MNVYWLLLFLFLHWVGDFLCQPRWVAENKGKNFWVLLLHTLMYGSVLALGTIWLVPQSMPIYKDPWAMWLGLNLVLHMMTDGVTSKFTARYWQEGKTHAFFSVVGLDQFLHHAALIGTTKMLLG